jgi:hypothetical protein
MPQPVVIDADTLAGVKRYLSDVLAEGSATERVIAQTVSRMLATPPTPASEVAQDAARIKQLEALLLQARDALEEEVNRRVCAWDGDEPESASASYAAIDAIDAALQESAMATENDAATIEAAMRAAFDAMTPEECRQFVRSLCGAVDKLAQVVVENADAIWENRHGD